MISVYEEKPTKALLKMYNNDKALKGAGLRNPSAGSFYTFVYNKGKAQRLTIDEIAYTLPSAAIVPLFANQHFSFEYPDELISWQFNREFYCVVDHDAEVGCAGFLFYGVQHPIIITLNAAEQETMLHLEKLFVEEWQSRDNFQGEMLRTLLKQLMIKTTRLAKQQSESYQQFSDEKMDIIRKFSLLLECHFKEEHRVSFYAAALNKSPKTLSNIFALLKQPAPSKLIQHRIVSEAKRYLYYTTKSAKEIAYELGFESPAHFSRFFKRDTGSNPLKFRAPAINLDH